MLESRPDPTRGLLTGEGGGVPGDAPAGEPIPGQTRSGTRTAERVPIGVMGLVVGLGLGGICLLPAARVTRERDPWLTILLGEGLAQARAAAQEEVRE